MIFRDPYWLDIVPSDPAAAQEEIAGKWLYFDETTRLHSLAPRLDQMVESGSIPSAKIAMKLPQYDPFPDKPCVLCVFTPDDTAKKDEIRRVIEDEFGISVVAWKSEEQTRQDWQAETGFLWVQAEINHIRREIAAGQENNLAESQRRILELTTRLNTIVSKLENPGRVIEAYPGTLLALQSTIEADLQADRHEPADLTHRLDTVESMAASVAELGEEKLIVVAQNERATLRRLMVAHFNVAELKEICFDLQIEYEDLDGSTRREKIMALISWMERRSRTGELLRLCRQLRPDADW